MLTVSNIQRERAENNINGPEECGRMECSEMILLWTVGLNGMCHPDAYGALIGQGGFKGFLMQVQLKHNLY